VPFHQAGSITYFRFSSLENPRLYHAIYTRHGGFSPAPWKSLNFGASVGDDPERVRQNREKALTILDINPHGVYDTYQVHSNEIVVTDRPLGMNESHIKADGIITNKPGVTLMMRFADCVPIILFDPVRYAIGIVHAGWIGTVNKIVAKAVTQMKESYGTIPGDIMAAIGPSIGACHYPVGTELIEKVQIRFGDEAEEIISHINGKFHLDLWEANHHILNEIGVVNVEIAGICTSCDLDNWYSHRGEHGKTGRFGVVLGLF